MLKGFWTIFSLGAPENWNKLSRQRKYSRQSFINNVWSINFHVTCATRIMFKLGYTARHHQCIFKHKNSAIGKQLLELRGSLCSLNANQLWIFRKCRADAVYQREQFTPQHNDRLYPCKTLCLRIFWDIYVQLLLIEYCPSQLYQIFLAALIFGLENNISSTSKRRWFLSIGNHMISSAIWNK